MRRLTGKHSSVWLVAPLSVVIGLGFGALVGSLRTVGPLATFVVMFVLLLPEVRERERRRGRDIWGRRRD